MKKIILICLACIPLFVYSQKPNIKNIGLDIRNNDVFISYDIDELKDSLQSLDLILIDNTKSVYIPESVSGNIGTNLNEGKNTISFNMIDQDFPLDRELVPSIILNHKVKSGPKASLLSVLVPGLGDYFVENPKNMVIKPYYRTLATGGFLMLAIMAHNNRPGSIYYEKDVTINDRYYDYQTHMYVDAWITVSKTYERSNPNNYWLFRNDKEIFIGAAAAIWFFDIFWVMNKGQQNQKIKKALKNKNYNFALSTTSFSCQINLK